MKGGFHGLRGKQVSLTLIALICMTILLWAWEKTPLLTTFLPPQNLGLMPDIITSEPTVELKSSIPDIHFNEHISDVVQKGDRRSEQPEKNFDASIVSASENTPELSTDEGKSAPFIEKKEVLRDVQHKETRSKPNLKEEARSKLDFKEETRSKPDFNEETRSKPDIKEETRSKPDFKEETRSSPDLKETSSEPVDDFFSITAPVHSRNVTTSKRGKGDNSNTTTVKKKVCNYGKGRWIEDSRRPLYSGFECKQWLSEMWACRLTQRTDFTYERFRWKPHDCEMPEFEGSSFLRRMQDKTIAIVGDSLGRQQFQSLMCMVTAGKETRDILDVGREYGLVKARGHTRPDGWAFRFRSTNTTILYYWSASLCELGPINVSDPATDWAMHLDRPAGFLLRYLDKFDVLVLNTGHHWNRGKLRANRWVMHVNGVPNTDRKLAEIGRAKNFTIYSVVKWLDLQLPKHPRLKAFFRTISPRHFFNGDWNSGGSCDNTTPLAGGKEVLKDESSDPSVAGAVNGTGVKILDITAFSQLRDEGHISRYSIKATPGVQDCLHWCLPGVPDTWNEVLIAQI